MAASQVDNPCPSNTEGVVNRSFSRDELQDGLRLTTFASNGRLSPGDRIPLSCMNGGGPPVTKVPLNGDLKSASTEYFIPMNNHKKFLRSGKLYITKEGPRSRWKAVACGLAVLIVLGAVSVGILAASGTLPPTPRPREALQAPVTQRQGAQSALVPNTLEGKLVLPNQVFEDALLDPSSASFARLSAPLEEGIRLIFDKSETKIESIKVFNFRPGSVVARFLCSWTLPLSPSEATQAVRKGLRRGRYMGALEVDPSTVAFYEVLDRCKVNNGGCSHRCSWRPLDLDFHCSCPPGLELTDSRRCVSPDRVTADGSRWKDGRQHDLDITTRVMTSLFPTALVTSPVPTRDPATEETVVPEHTSTAATTLTASSRDSSTRLPPPEELNSSEPTTAGELESSTETESIQTSSLATSGGIATTELIHGTSSPPVATASTEDVTAASPELATTTDGSQSTAELATATTAIHQEESTSAANHSGSEAITTPSQQNDTDFEVITTTLTSIESDPLVSVKTEDTTAWADATTVGLQDPATSTLASPTVTESISRETAGATTEMLAVVTADPTTTSKAESTVEDVEPTTRIAADAELMTGTSPAGVTETAEATTGETSLATTAEMTTTLDDETLENSEATSRGPPTTFELPDETSAVMEEATTSLPETGTPTTEDGTTTPAVTLQTISPGSQRNTKSLFLDDPQSTEGVTTVPLETTNSITEETTLDVADHNATSKMVDILENSEESRTTTEFPSDNITTTSSGLNQATPVIQTTESLTLNASDAMAVTLNTADYSIENTTFLDRTLLNVEEEAALLNDTTATETVTEGELIAFNNSYGTRALDLDQVKPTEGECLPDEVPCGNSSLCIPSKYLCDGVKDCPSGFDEEECEDCSDNFKCANWTCIPQELHCDGIWDCEDGLDEEDCRPENCAANEVKCSDGSSCIKPGDICDNAYNCRDRSDELGCVDKSACLADGRFFCPEGLCISWGLRCDGQMDCKAGEDESNCTCDSATEFRCLNSSCIPRELQCDGATDCVDGSDEAACAQVDRNGVVSAWDPVAARWKPVCGQGWNMEGGTALCQYLGYSGAKSTQLFWLQASGDEWISLGNSTGETWTLGLSRNSTCDLPVAAGLQCVTFECGQPMESLQRRRKRIVDGQPSLLGQWSTIVVVRGGDETTLCQGVLLSPLWVVTSADCLLRLGPGPWTVHAGLLANGTGPLPVKSVFFHPQASKFRSGQVRDFDVALVRMEAPLPLDRHTVAAICLPEEEVHQGITCFTGSYGSLSPRSPPQEPLLSQSHLALQVMDREVCGQPDRLNQPISPRMLCTNPDSSPSHLCNNDEGAPLMCLDYNGRKWSLAGLLSYQRLCGAYKSQPSIFSNVFQLKGFIKQIVTLRNYGVDPDPRMYARSEEVNQDIFSFTPAWADRENATTTEVPTSTLSNDTITAVYYVDLSPGDNSTEAPANATDPASPDNTTTTTTDFDALLIETQTNNLPFPEQYEKMENSTVNDTETTTAPQAVTTTTIAEEITTEYDNITQTDVPSLETSSLLTEEPENVTTEAVDLSTPHPPNCPEDQFQCFPSGPCLPRIHLCDTLVDCPGGQDEWACNSSVCLAGEHRCGDGHCIPASLVCDNQTDCLDNSDEANCTAECPGFRCREGLCLDTRWRCNGIPDCLEGEDELNCTLCSGPDEVPCAGELCAQRCDGKPECPDGRDEANCVQLSPLALWRRGAWSPVCADGWSANLSRSVCRTLGLDLAADNLTSANLTTALLANTSHPGAVALGALGLREDECPSGKGVEVYCKEQECGSWSPQLEQRKGRLLGGDPVLPGLWPPVVALRPADGGGPACVASVLGPQWALTSWRCAAGRAEWQLDAGEAGNFSVTRIVPHPDARRRQGVAYRDLAMVRLSSPLPLGSRAVEAVCLPSRPQSSSQICVAAGWGPEGDLHYLPVPVVDDCALHYGKLLEYGPLLCAGYLDGNKTACQADLGAPLMCINQAHQWEVYGVLAWQTSCPWHGAPRPALYTSVLELRPWVLSLLST